MPVAPGYVATVSGVQKTAEFTVPYNSQFCYKLKSGAKFCFPSKGEFSATLQSDCTLVVDQYIYKGPAGVPLIDCPLPGNHSNHNHTKALVVEETTRAAVVTPTVCSLPKCSATKCATVTGGTMKQICSCGVGSFCLAQEKIAGSNPYRCTEIKKSGTSYEYRE